MRRSHSDLTKELMAEKRRQWHRQHPNFSMSETAKVAISAAHLQRNLIINESKRNQKDGITVQNL